MRRDWRTYVQASRHEAGGGMRRPRWRWSCWLCPCWGHAEDGLDAFAEFEKHYAEKHMRERE